MAPGLPRRFNKYGLLPPGEYPLTISELRNSMLVKGPEPQIEGWAGDWRRKLVDNLEVMVRQLWQIGLDKIYVDGSFVEDKVHPNDIDGYFECSVFDYAKGDIERKLNLLDPHKAWTWDDAKRRPHPDSGKAQLPMWHTYRVELWPHYGGSSGIVDEFGHSLTFPSAFRRCRRENREKGIVRLMK